MIEINNELPNTFFWNKEMYNVNYSDSEQFHPCPRGLAVKVVYSCVGGSGSMLLKFYFFLNILKLNTSFSFIYFDQFKGQDLIIRMYLLFFMMK